MKIRYQVIFVIILLLLFAPVLQQKFGVFKEYPLHGYIKSFELPNISFKSIMSVQYQNQLEQYLKREIGFHPLFIRINNQINYSLFNKSNAATIVLGEENHFFGKGYIDTYFGQDYIGSKAILNKATKISSLQDTLGKLGKHIVIVMAAGKPYVQPEYIPQQYIKQADSTNYNLFKYYFDLLNVNNIDFIPVLNYMNDTAKHVIYPKAAIHWSTYAAYYVADSIVSYIECITETTLPKISYSNIEYTSHARFADKDIEGGMNLLFKLEGQAFAYPQTFIDSSVVSPKLNTLIVGDSFYWNINKSGFPNVFKAYNFWYYFHEVYPGNDKPLLDAQDLNLKAELEKRDLIIIVSNPSTFKSMAWGFVDECYSLYFGNDEM